MQYHNISFNIIRSHLLGSTLGRRFGGWSGSFFLFVVLLVVLVLDNILLALRIQYQ